jgi:hypothetical protein
VVLGEGMVLKEGKCVVGAVTDGTTTDKGSGTLYEQCSGEDTE